jgi:hypothetical protein
MIDSIISFFFWVRNRPYDIGLSMDLIGLGQFSPSINIFSN